MTDKQPPEALRQAAWLKKEGASCQRHYDLGVLIERQHAELETLRARFAESDMTGKQLEALELASLADTADLAGYPTAKKANAYCLCLLEDCAQMIRRLHAENETLRAGYAAARLDVDALAQEIRRVDGAHKLGAGALAEALMPFLRASRGQASSQAAPAAMYSDLRARCLELLNWHRTGVLSGKALRAMARRKYGDDPNAIQRAERDTETEALNLVAAAPTTQPASQADSQPAPVSANHADLPPLPDPDTRDVGTAPGGIKEFLRGYATEYAKAAIAARKQGANHD